MSERDIFDADRLDRYRSIVPDWNAFREAVVRPLPLCIWTNTLRTTPADVVRHLQREMIDAEPLEWHPGAFRGLPSEHAGQSMPFVAGLYHIQEEVSLLPVALLAPRPGERILDLCSAPGNKTAQMAVAMENTGTIIANDRDGMRTRATRGVLDRLGVVNTTITIEDASNLPESMGLFDRVLADVPCTCEGTTRKHIDALRQSGRETSLRLQRRQIAILRKAMQLCRPGGIVAYSTCTYAPEENEAVVHAALDSADDAFDVLPARIEGFHASPGLTTWNGIDFAPELEHCMRVWPHQNDSGGFFVALLQKKGEPESSFTEEGIGPAQFACNPEQEEHWKALLQQRFAIGRHDLERLRLHEPNNKYVAAVSADHRTLVDPEPVSIGMPLIRVGLRFPKLTTAGARLLGSCASRNVVDADASQARAYMDRREFYLSTRQTEGVSGTGYVLVAHADTILGVGLFLEEHSVVKSLFPKVLARAVSD